MIHLGGRDQPVLRQALDAEGMACQVMLSGSLPAAAIESLDVRIPLLIVGPGRFGLVPVAVLAISKLRTARGTAGL